MPSSLLLDELRSEFERESDLKKILEGKADGIITIAGTIVALLFGFTTFASSTLHHTIIQTLTIPFYFIMVGISGCIASMLLSAWSLRLSNYAVPSNIEMFFNKDGSRNEQQIARYKNAENYQIIRSIIDRYIDSIKINLNLNSKKGKKINWAYGFLFGSIASIAVAIVIALLQLTISN